MGEDTPAYWLCQKVIASLGEIGTPEALECLRRMTASSWPDAVRWHAAVELENEEELGFDEDRMLA
ncbi:HEAT repeat domain-containing protein [Streptomyces chrestomyceticus]|uniref:HEAT repeat domain-containing protein n=1 Tax=Streptomyces chrestomyceticus TaxID=68185 RepID=UPI0035A84EDD